LRGFGKERRHGWKLCCGQQEAFTLLNPYKKYGVRRKDRKHDHVKVTLTLLLPVFKDPTYAKIAIGIFVFRF
jgi:hypothetical protein